MGKQADKFILCEPYAIAAEGFHPTRNRVMESLFSLANEYMGVRGYAEEGVEAPSLLGSYFNGVYEWGNEPEGGTYLGVARKTHYMVCAADWLYTRVRVNGEPVRLRPQAEDFRYRLDFQNGLLTRSYAVPLANGARLKLRFERILGMERWQAAAQRITLACDRDASLALELGVDGSVRHAATGKCLWQEKARQSEGLRGGISFATGTTDEEIAYLFELVAPGMAASPARLGAGLALRLTAELKAGEPLAVERQALNLVNPGKWTLDTLNRAPSFDELLRENADHWRRFWQDCNVVIEGDAEAQQGIRFCLFQLHQTYRGLDGAHNVGAKGLTGEAYNGHAFWDSETYCLPYYLLNDPAAAKGLLMYRYHTLPQAKKRARQLDCKGACYPIATLNGDEACTLWQHASLQMQPSTAVAYGIMLYARRTGDMDFLYRYGIEMLCEISRYVVSRGDWNAEGTGFGFWDVMGPDEFHMMVNNDFYTNFMGRRTLEYTLEVLSGAPDPDRWCTAQEREQWREIAGHILVCQREDGVYEQQDGFFDLPHLDAHSIPTREFPLYDHWSYDRIYRTDMIKQPDVLMAMFLYPERFTDEEVRANYDYYEPRCIHESSLSPSVHAILAQRLGRAEDAFRFFGFATRMDLDNYNRNTGDGLHTTSIAAAWVTIVFGFGGLRLTEAGVSLNPSLPEAWQGYSFQLRVRESVIRVMVTRAGSALALVRGEPVTVLLNGALTEVRA